MCHHCALFSGDHSQHTFSPLDDIYRDHRSRVDTELERLKQRRTDLIGVVQVFLCILESLIDTSDFIVLLSLIKEMERAVERTKSAKEERVREMRRAVEQMIERLDGQLRSVE